jgi:hypothetical protein
MVALLDGMEREHATRVPPRRIGRAGYWLRVVLVVVAVAHRRPDPPDRLHQEQAWLARRGGDPQERGIASEGVIAYLIQTRNPTVPVVTARHLPSMLRQHPAVLGPEGVAAVASQARIRFRAVA